MMPMRLMHFSDIHIGKRLGERSLIEDQSHILNEILALIDAHEPQAVCIAGDIYDKSTPSAEAVALFDQFLYQLSRRNVPVFAISGNHDSPERIAFAGRILSENGLFFSPVYDGSIDPVTLSDELGEVDFFCLPFIKPAHVRHAFPEEKIDSHSDAVRVALSHVSLDPSRRNVLIAHQFITGARQSESEDISVGGADNVDAAIFADFDYVALGHLHAAQSVSREGIRYCGAPLKYDFAESDHQKSVTLVDLGEKGALKIQILPLTPLHDMRRLRGNYMEVTHRDFYRNTPTDDFLHITLTDEQEIPDAIRKLRTIYPNVMQLSYDNCRTRATGAPSPAQILKTTHPLQLFSDFYTKQNGQPPSTDQIRLLSSLIESIWEVNP